MGTIYKRGKTYWIKYSRNGKWYFESSQSRYKSVASEFLKKREGEISNGKIPGIYFDRIKFDELAEEFLADYRINQKKSLRRAKLSVSHLFDVFEGMRVTDITTPMIQRYIQNRLDCECEACKTRFVIQEDPVCPKCGREDYKPGATNATINRELAALKRALNLGARQTPPKVDRVPYIPMLKESNTRKGFFEHGDFIKLRDVMPDHLKGLITFAYKTGWRLTEVTTLKWSQVDLHNRTVRLEPGDPKNEEARTVFLDDELQQIFESLYDSRKNLLPHVFLNENGTDHVKRFDKSWKTACKEAKIGKKLFHDFRRTAVRNMVRSGIPERVAMMISGHKSRSVFDRYNIVSDTDLKLAAKQQEAFLKSQTVTKTVTIEDFQEKRANHDIG